MSPRLSLSDLSPKHQAEVAAQLGGVGVWKTSEASVTIGWKELGLKPEYLLEEGNLADSPLGKLVSEKNPVACSTTFKFETTKLITTPAILAVTFTIPGEPMGKPRMTQRDKWAKRDCVLRYRDWADSARACVPVGMSTSPAVVRVVAYFPMPASWSKNKKANLCGAIHRQKPDVDNIAKSVMDALWKDDSCIAELGIKKFWTNSGSARVEVEVLP